MLDEGYWQALLRDVEDEPLPAAWVDFDEAMDKPHGVERHRVALGDAEADWVRAEALLQSSEPVEVIVSGYNKGGLLADFGCIQGFVPASHLLNPPLARTPAERMAALAARVGEKLTVRVVEIERNEYRLILSERMARQDGQPSQVMENLRPGQICRGRVTSLCPFGAFVDLGGFEGLLHVSELSWSRVASPAEVVRPGDVVDLLVLDVRPKEQKVALSLKRLRPDPWQGVEERYHVGQVVNAVVTNVTNFGAFARLEEGLEGLIHVSELAEGSFLHPRNVIREGDCVRARVLHVDSARRRLALTMRSGGPATQNRQSPTKDSMPV